MTKWAPLNYITWMEYCQKKVKVGRKKQEVCYEPGIWGECRVAMHHILDWDHHRDPDRCQHCAPSYVLPLKKVTRR